MVALTFPDGARREYPPGTTGLDIAKGISPSLAKRTVAMALDGSLADLSDPIERDAKIEFISREDPRALELIRHDAAHVLAEAVQSLWPGTQVTIGPVIENGFYYDFARNQPFTLEDLPVTMSLELGRRRMILDEVADLGEQSLVELDRKVGDPVDVYLNGRLFARGEVVTVSENFGVRITEIVGQA